MLFNRFESEKALLWKKFQAPFFAPECGMDNSAVKNALRKLADENSSLPHILVKALAFEYVCDHIAIDATNYDWFPSFGCWNRHDRPLSVLTECWYNEVENSSACDMELRRTLHETGAVVCWLDFDHSVPNWDVLFQIGFAGLPDLVAQYHMKYLNSKAANKVFYESMEIVCRAMLRMIDRLHDVNRDKARTLHDERLNIVADALAALKHRPPRNTYEGLLLIYLYFIFGEHIDRIQVRSLGNLDRLLGPLYQRDLANGIFTEIQLREILDYFLMQFASIDNYWGHPFFLGGTRADGTTEYNEFSHLILTEYDRLAITTPKIQLKMAANTPASIWDLALDMIRRGRNGIVFLSESAIGHVFAARGWSAEEARLCDISGCYEFWPRDSNRTVAGHVNILKAVELALHGGVDLKTCKKCGVDSGCISDFDTFEKLLAAFFKQLEFLTETAMAISNCLEMRLAEVNPALVYSATIRNSLATGQDAFSTGGIYNDSAILQVGLASATDALMAVKKFVFERKELPLSELCRILAENWSGHELLRRKILRFSSKYGNGEPEADQLAQRIAIFFTGLINGRPNSRGGCFMASGHCAKQFIRQGMATGATPDGRFDAEELSKNLSPTMGADTNGITALIHSVTKIDSGLFPADFPLDVMLLPGSVSGRSGLDAMRGAIQTYFDRNGIAIHFNICDSAVLEDAKIHPEKHANLQIRICGWSGYFIKMENSEQDAYLRRARNITN